MKLHVLCCLFATSCSWAFVRAPEAGPPIDDPGDCTESRTAPVADVAWTALFSLTTLVVAGRCYEKSRGGLEQDGSPAQPCTVGPYVGLSLSALLGVASAVSAYQGFRHTGECRDRRALARPITAR